LQATDGNFFGDIPASAGKVKGEVFRFSLGLGPFIKTAPLFGPPGARVTILGCHLHGAISVAFNGTPASFTVNSTGTAIISKVPAGASTGTVKVVLPGGTLSSNVAFQVTRK